MRRKDRAWFALVTVLTVSCLGSVLFALGQGGTGRETPNANAGKNTSSKRTPSPRKARSTKRSTGPANKTRKGVPGTDDSVAERTYWETIRRSSDPEDFKAYLKKYPTGQFADLARNSLRRLESAAKPTDKKGSTSAEPILIGPISGSNAAAAKPAPKPGSIVRNQMAMELVYVPPGSFLMGSSNGQPNEKPVHKVTIREGFYMGRYEVTQAEWKNVMGSNSSYFKGDRLPVEQVTWGQAQSFIQKLNARGEQFFYRLPTEAEWEYACRAGTTGDYAGNLPEMAWFADNAGRKTHDVGGKRPNAWGLADMHGNVWEWCADVHHESYSGAPTDGSAWLSGEDGMKDRILRGGSWVDPAPFLRTAFRLASSGPTASSGFRVVAIVRAQ